MIKKLVLLAVLGLYILPYVVLANVSPIKSRVIDIVSSESKSIEGFGISATNQVLTVLILEGEDKGLQKTFTQDKFETKEGETIFIQKNDEGKYQVLEKDRTPMITSLLGLFGLLVLVLNGAQGVRSIVGLLLSFVVIIFALLPLVIAGFNPLIVSIILGGIILASVLYLSHGFNRGSTIALSGTLGAIICAGLLSLGVSIWMRLTGLSDDESVSALMVTQGGVDFASLLLAGIIIGMLGVLDDIAVTQVSVVGEIKKANPNLSPKEVFVRALRVGKEHVSALVNTLVLAYTGASFPLLILLYKSDIRFDLLISQEIVSVEIVRILVGSMGLIIAVPFTTYLAVKFLKNSDTIKSHCSYTGH